MSQYIPAGDDSTTATAAYLYGQQKEDQSSYTGKVSVGKLAGLGAIGLVAFLIWASRK